MLFIAFFLLVIIFFTILFLIYYYSGDNLLIFVLAGLFLFLFKDSLSFIDLFIMLKFSLLFIMSKACFDYFFLLNEYIDENTPPSTLYFYFSFSSVIFNFTLAFYWSISLWFWLYKFVFFNFFNFYSSSNKYFSIFCFIVVKVTKLFDCFLVLFNSFYSFKSDEKFNLVFLLLISSLRLCSRRDEFYYCIFCE